MFLTSATFEAADTCLQKVLDETTSGESSGGTSDPLTLLKFSRKELSRKRKRSHSSSFDVYAS